MIRAAATLSPRPPGGVSRARRAETIAVSPAPQPTEPRNTPATTAAAPDPPPVPAPMLANRAANDRMVAGLASVSATIDAQADAGRAIAAGSARATGLPSPLRSAEASARTAITTSAAPPAIPSHRSMPTRSSVTAVRPKAAIAAYAASAVATPTPDRKPYAQPRSSVRRMTRRPTGPRAKATANPIARPRTNSSAVTPRRARTGSPGAEHTVEGRRPARPTVCDERGQGTAVRSARPRAPGGRDGRGSAPRQDDDPPVRLLADRLRRDGLVVAKRQVDPAPLEGGHRLQLEHLAGLDDALRGACGEVDQLPLASAAVVLDVDEDTCPLAGPPREHQVDEVLERREALALAADERPEGLAIGAVADHVEPAGLALADLDGHALEAEVAHQRLEDLATRGQRLRRGLRRLELGALHGERPACGRDRGDLGRAQLGAAARGTVVLPGSGGAAVVATGPAIGVLPPGSAAGPVVAARGAVTALRPVAVVAARRGTRTVVAARPTVATLGPVAVLRSRAAILAGRLRRHWLGLGGFALGCGPAERAAWRRHDPCRLRAHAEDPAAARGEDLEVEVPQAHAELVAGRLDGLLDGLAGELLVLAHVSVVSLVGRSAVGSAGSSIGPRCLDRRLLPGAPPRPLIDRSQAAWGSGSSPGSAACDCARTPGTTRTAGTSRPSRG